MFEFIAKQAALSFTDSLTRATTHTPTAAAPRVSALFISNARKCVPIWGQRRSESEQAAAEAEGGGNGDEPMLWDYHGTVLLCCVVWVLGAWGPFVYYDAIDTSCLTRSSPSSSHPTHSRLPRRTPIPRPDTRPRRCHRHRKRPDIRPRHHTRAVPLPGPALCGGGLPPARLHPGRFSTVSEFGLVCVVSWALWVKEGLGIDPLHKNDDGHPANTHTPSPSIHRHNNAHTQTQTRRLRLVPFPLLQQRFASDRSHMRRPDGGWNAPPPSWPPIR